jgi:hypothetical protein
LIVEYFNLFGLHEGSKQNEFIMKVDLWFLFDVNDNWLITFEAIIERWQELLYLSLGQLVGIRPLEETFAIA